MGGVLREGMGAWAHTSVSEDVEGGCVEELVRGRGGFGLCCEDPRRSALGAYEHKPGHGEGEAQRMVEGILLECHLPCGRGLPDGCRPALGRGVDPQRGFWQEARGNPHVLGECRGGVVCGNHAGVDCVSDVTVEDYGVLVDVQAHSEGVFG